MKADSPDSLAFNERARERRKERGREKGNEQVGYGGIGKINR